MFPILIILIILIRYSALVGKWDMDRGISKWGGGGGGMSLLHELCGNGTSATISISIEIPTPTPIPRIRP